MALLNEKRDKVFLVFRSDYPIWGEVGGAIELGETPDQAVIREAKEETGMKVELIKHVGIYILPSGHKEYLFEGRVIGGSFKPEFPGCRGKWFDVTRLPLSMTYHSKRMVNDAVNFTGEIPFEKQIRGLSARENWHLIFLHPLAMGKFLKKWMKRL